MGTSVKRDVAIDVMKGLAILLVILGHFECIPDIGHWIFSFHMPLFFLVAGYFHKSALTKGSFKKEVNRLVVPYLFTMGILLMYSIVVNCVMRINLHQVSLTFWAMVFPTGTNFANSVPVWFLLALFWCRECFGALLRWISPFKSAVIAILVGVISTILCNYIPIETPFSILAGLSALTFYSIGFMFYRYRKYVPTLFLFLLPVVWIVCYRFCNVSMISCEYHNYPLSVLCALGGTIGIYMVSNLIAKSAVVEGIFSWFGINSLVILCGHTIERYLPTPYGMLIELSSVWVVFALKIALCVIFTLCCYKCRVTRKIFNLKR